MKHWHKRFGTIILAHGTVALFVVVLAFATFPSQAFAKYASIVVDADTGAVLHEENADTRNFPASLTKIMTLYMLFEAIDTGRIKLDQELPVSANAQKQEPSKLNLRKGQTIKARDAILALVTKSANDVAVVVAEAVGDSETRFARMMTVKALALGMKRTQFRNASGLPDDRQLSSARDMSILARALMRNFPRYYPYFLTEQFAYKGEIYGNHNGLLGTYDGVDGIKTGYIRASGFNLVASAERDGRRIIGVVFGGKTSAWRNKHMVGLLDDGFEKVTRIARAAKPLLETADYEPPLTKPVLNTAKRPSSKVELALAPTKAPPPPPLAVTPKTVAPAAVLPAAVAPEAVALDVAVTEWSIQVGAFRQFALAQAAVDRASSLAPTLLEDAVVHIFPVQSRTGPLFRARLTGFDKGTASKACSLLMAKRMDCLAVPPPQGTEVAFATQ
ncbi:MAG: D-alanyl-D-alanine carboxypeptidase [Proteobacteria bacterium]|nr:D-alanyl-D-alanine carboxypeptidase [Pseudomonadota bacterium]